MRPLDSVRAGLVSFLRLPGVRPCARAALGGIVRVRAGAYPPPRERLSVMQVGGRGGADPYTEWLRRRGKARTIGVEPEAAGLEELRKNNAYDAVIGEAFSDTDGAATLHVTKARGWCSLLTPDEAAIARVATETCIRVRPFEVVHTEEIRLTTIDAVAKTVLPIDYLQIDVQGAELAVLRGAAETLKSVSVVEIETRFYPIYQNEPLFPDLHAFFDAHGFQLFQMTPQGSREFGGNLVEVNACYLNRVLAAAAPERMADLRRYAAAKHALYADPFLRLLGDL